MAQGIGGNRAEWDHTPDIGSGGHEGSSIIIDLANGLLDDVLPLQFAVTYPRPIQIMSMISSSKYFEVDPFDEAKLHLLIV